MSIAVNTTGSARCDDCGSREPPLLRYVVAIGEDNGDEMICARCFAKLEGAGAFARAVADFFAGDVDAIAAVDGVSLFQRARERSETASGALKHANTVDGRDRVDVAGEEIREREKEEVTIMVETNVENIVLEQVSTAPNMTLCLQTVPKTWSRVQRVRVEGPAELERMTIARTSFEPKDGLEADGTLSPGADDARDIGPGSLGRVYVKTTGIGNVKAILEVEPLPPAGRYGES